MGLIKRLKKNKKGFTLVELIVVLVILAILAAIAVPTFNSYITKAKDKTVAAEARTVLLAANTLIAEANETAVASETEVTLEKIASLAGVEASTLSNLKITAGELNTLTYTKNGIAYVYDGTKHIMKKQ